MLISNERPHKNRVFQCLRSFLIELKLNKNQISDFTGKYQGSCFFMILTQNVSQHIITYCRELMKKYKDLPMDLADGSLVVLAESKNLEKVFTLDHKDFKIYRFARDKKFKLLPARLSY